MVGDMTEVTQLLHKAVKKNNNNEQKDKESVQNDVKSCDIDTIDKSTLDGTIQSHAQNDRHETEDIALKVLSNDGSDKDCYVPHEFKCIRYRMFRKRLDNKRTRKDIQSMSKFRIRNAHIGI